VGETLTSRLVDRPLRPLFPSGWAHETQVLQWVLSYDSAHRPEVHAITAASAALLLSAAPFTRAVASVQVGRVGGKLVVNPGAEELEASDLDLTMAGTEFGVMMIEGFADFLPEEEILEAVAEGHRAIAEICRPMQVLHAFNLLPSSLTQLVVHTAWHPCSIVARARSCLVAQTHAAPEGHLNAQEVGEYGSKVTNIYKTMRGIVCCQSGGVGCPPNKQTKSLNCPTAE
jgi:hypothetical protein